MVRISDDDSRDRRGFDKPAKLQFSERNWIDNVEAVGGNERAGKEIGFNRRIEGLPEPDAGMGLMNFSIGHRGKDGEN